MMSPFVSVTTPPVGSTGVKVCDEANAEK